VGLFRFIWSREVWIMVKLIANVAKKMPLAGVPYSNQEFAAVLEVEVPDNTPDASIQERYRELYALLGQTVEEQIAVAGEAARDAGTDANARGYDGRNDDAPSNRNDGRGWRDNPRDGGDGRRDNWRDRQNHRDGNKGRQDRRDDGGRGNGSRQGGGWRAGNNGNGGGRDGQASNAQVKAIFGIARSQGIDRRDLMERIEDLYRARRVEDLTVREASEFIESLKAA